MYPKVILRGIKNYEAMKDVPDIAEFAWGHLTKKNIGQHRGDVISIGLPGKKRHYYAYLTSTKTIVIDGQGREESNENQDCFE